MKQAIDLNNKYRVLLTEVLPYELPLVLNNEAFYHNIQDEKLREAFGGIFTGVVAPGEWTIPFDYDIRRAGGEKSRKLSLMHPVSQLDCVEHYAKYDEYMLSLCSHSPFSIRHIDKKAKCVFPPDEVDETAKEDEMERHVELEDGEIERRYRSYFSYKKYDLAYKFFESGDNLRLEQKYPYMMTLDVAACFYHIYTHSIAWAIKGKEVAKENKRKDTFENSFDLLMQHTNYNETNGIIVGPEISRIFAEIILQAVDLAVLRRLKEKNYSLGRDYEIRRYVDDSIVYATTREKLEAIRDVYQEQLAAYKLDINKSKLSFFDRPFTSCMSDAKNQINELVSKFKEHYLKKGEDGKYVKGIRNEMSVFTEFIKQFRSITHQHQQSYGLLNKYTLTLLLRQIRKEKKSACAPSQGLLTAYTEIAFYIFSLDMHTTASYRLCSILDCLMGWADFNPDTMVKHELKDRIRRESKRVLDIYQITQKASDTNLEALNLLISIDRLIGFKATVGQLEIIFGINVDSGIGFDDLNYFQICVLFSLIENDFDFNPLKDKMEAEVISRFSEKKRMRESETAHLFFDLMTCPYVSRNTKRTIVQIVCEVKNINKIDERIKTIARPNRWFFDWDKSHTLTSFLTKKEYHSPYE